MNSKLKILRLPAVLDRSGASKSTLYDWIADCTWTEPVPVGARMVGWPESEVDALIAARISGLPEADIQSLVAQLTHERQELLRILRGQHAPSPQRP
jgi:prophage regulatory protein